MKKIISLMLALLLAFSLAGCSQKEEKISLTFWTTPVLADEEKMESLIQEFEKKNPQVDVELEYLAWEGVSEKLQIALSSGKTPDVYLDGAARTATLPQMGVLVPVSDLYDEIGQWNVTVKNFGMKDGVHYLIPASQIATSTVTINVSLAKELGVYDLLPKDRLSWNIQDFYRFVEAASLAGKEKGIKGVGLYAGSSTSDDAIYSLFLSNGGVLVDKENNVSLANSPACVEVAQVLSDIVRNGCCLDGAALLTSGDIMTPFLNQQVVVHFGDPASAMIPLFEDMKKDGYLETVPEIATYGIPHAEGQDMISACWGANGLAIFDHKDEKKTEAAKAFVKFLMTDSTFPQDVWVSASNYMPSRHVKVDFPSENEQVKNEVLFHQELTAKYANFEFGILDNYWPQVRNKFYPEMQALYSGEKTAQEAMDSFTAGVNQILADSKK